jgi:hypothetical protein
MTSGNQQVCMLQLMSPGGGGKVGKATACPGIPALLLLVMLLMQ